MDTNRQQRRGQYNEMQQYVEVDAFVVAIFVVG